MQTPYKPKIALIFRDPRVLFLSFFGAGFFPKAPGTFGSFCALPLLFLLGTYQTPVLLIATFIIIGIALASWQTEILQKKFHLHDPQWIVIDEVLGMLTTFCFSPNANFFNLAAIFFLFRIFDIIKIWPASYFDKKINHGAGTILDDIFSAFWAGLALLASQKFF